VLILFSLVCRRLHQFPPLECQDVYQERELEVKKSNYGRAGEKIKLRWNGLTFVPAKSGESSLYRSAVERDVGRAFPQIKKPSAPSW